MLKRTLFFSNPYHLSVEYQQLVITNKDTGEIKKAPIEDIGFVVLEHPHISITQAVIQYMAANNAVIVFCSDTYLPVSMTFHLDTNQVQNQRFRAQLAASEPLKKQLWQQTIRAKIRNQAALIGELGMDNQALLYMAGEVKSGDSGNEEARAAKKYWGLLFGDGFRRERYGAAPNAALNYGYTILRAAVARAICGSGLLPTLGIFHANKYNHYALADDIMEPYRPWVDRLVHHLWKKGEDLNALQKEHKAHLLSLLASDITISGSLSPLMVGLSQTTASLARCFEGSQKKLVYPEL